MRREGRKALLDALLIADVDQHLLIDRNSAVFCYRKHQTAHRHQGHQADGFQGNRFTAGVRSGDDQCIEILSENNIGGNNLFRVNQRVAGFFQLNETAVLNVWNRCLHLICKRGLGKIQINFDQCPIAVQNRLCKGTDQRRQLCDDSFDFPFFLCLQDANLVVCLYDCHRLDEDGRSACRGVVNQAFDFGAVFALDRNNEAAVSHGNQRFLKVLALVRGFNQVVQPFSNPELCLIDFSAQIAQFAAGCIRQLLLRQNGVVQGCLQLTVRGQNLKQRVQRGLFPFAAFAPILDRTDIVQNGGDIHQFSQRKVRAFLRFTQSGFTVFQSM